MFFVSIVKYRPFVSQMPKSRKSHDVADTSKVTLSAAMAESLTMPHTLQGHAIRCNG